MPFSQMGAGEHGRLVIIMNVLKMKLSSPRYLSQDQLYCPSAVLHFPRKEVLSEVGHQVDIWNWIQPLIYSNLLSSN